MKGQEVIEEQGDGYEEVEGKGERGEGRGGEALLRQLLPCSYIQHHS